jgi:regulator of replication initiation timing
MTETGVDGNFQRLEEEVNRLLEILEKLRGENANLKERLATLESAQQELEGQNRQAQERDGQVRDRLESLLSRLDQANL